MKLTGNHLMLPDNALAKNSYNIDAILSIMGIGFVAYFFFAWISFPSWVHFEFKFYGPNFLLAPGENFFTDSFGYIFNLALAEDRFYRPRALSFLVQYLDTNLSLQLFKYYPGIGIKLPSYGVSIIATVAAFVWFWRTLFPQHGYGVGLLGGAALLYFSVYTNTSFMVLRGGKFLAAAAAIVCITIFIRQCSQSYSFKKSGKYMLYAFPLTDS